MLQGAGAVLVGALAFWGGMDHLTNFWDFWFPPLKMVDIFNCFPGMSGKLLFVSRFFDPVNEKKICWKCRRVSDLDILEIFGQVGNRVCSFLETLYLQTTPLSLCPLSACPVPTARRRSEGSSLWPPLAPRCSCCHGWAERSMRCVSSPKTLKCIGTHSVLETILGLSVQAPVASYWRITFLVVNGVAAICLHCESEPFLSNILTESEPLYSILR